VGFVHNDMIMSLAGDGTLRQPLFAAVPISGFITVEQTQIHLMNQRGRLFRCGSALYFITGLRTMFR
jgi:hypothetical protein